MTYLIIQKLSSTSSNFWMYLIGLSPLALLLFKKIKEPKVINLRKRMILYIVLGIVFFIAGLVLVVGALIETGIIVGIFGIISLLASYGCFSGAFWLARKLEKTAS